MLGSARVPLQIDVGFGDAVTPSAEVTTFPALLDFPAPRVRAYPAASVVAEKFQAMVALGIANTRMKDFYDLYRLSETQAFDGETLAAAIGATFERRGTAIPTELPLALGDAFAGDAEPAPRKAPGGQQAVCVFPGGARGGGGHRGGGRGGWGGGGGGGEGGGGMTEWTSFPLGGPSTQSVRRRRGPSVQLAARTPL